jgi:predicted sulfurtransferase
VVRAQQKLEAAEAEGASADKIAKRRIKVEEAVAALGLAQSVVKARRKLEKAVSENADAAEISKRKVCVYGLLLYLIFSFVTHVILIYRFTTIIFSYFLPTVYVYQAKLVALGVPAASIGASSSIDESVTESKLRHDYKSGPASATTSTRTKSDDDAGPKTSAQTSGATGPRTEPPPEAERADWVLAKNGQWYPKPGTIAFQAMKAAQGAAVPCNTSLLLFYAYVQPPWTPKERAKAIEYTHGVLESNGCGGRLRVALEGFNATLTGPPQGIRAFCDALREYDPTQFSNIDFKIVDNLEDSKGFKTLKVWPVDALVNYGIDAADTQAPLDHGGYHAKPDEWTELSKRPNTIMIDVRNANETAIGRFQPPSGGAVLLDPRMRRSTEFPQWLDDHADEIRGKHVMMYCTAGIRCERASALLATKGLASDIVQVCCETKRINTWGFFV